jgi:hypothetical protein
MGPNALFSFIRSSKRKVLHPLSNFSALPPALYRDFCWFGGPTRWCLVFCSHRDYFIVTRNFSAVYLDLLLFRSFTVTLSFSAFYRDWQKTRHRDADGN